MKAVAESFGYFASLLECDPLILISYPGPKPSTIRDALDSSCKRFIHGIDLRVRERIQMLKVSAIRDGLVITGD